MTPGWRRRFLYAAVAASPLLLALAIALDRARPRPWSFGGESPKVQGRTERCLTCHATEARALAPHHAPPALGCSSCHLGNPAALAKNRAHVGLERFPGDFATLPKTCGRTGCHPEAAARVHTSLMGTARGILAVNRFVFGERPVPDGEEGLGDLTPMPGHDTPATDHARKLCASCHLGTHHVSARVRTRGGGCSACHLEPGAEDGAHPRLAMGVSPGKCTGCHARSGRISLSYYGWHEGTAPEWLQPSPSPKTPAQPPQRPATRRLADGRVVRRALADVHAEAGMGCLDCHTSVGLMGDGDVHLHEEDQVDIACTDCHAAPKAPLRRAPVRAPGRTRAQRDPQPTALRAASLRIARRLYPTGAWRHGAPVLRTARGTPLFALHERPDGSRWLRRRSDDRWIRVRAVPGDAAHRLPGHERLTCQACHTSWTHQCTGCHTRKDPNGSQWDSVAGRRTPGRWRERSGDVRIDRPTLGVDARNCIRPFVPGMPICLGAGARANPAASASAPPGSRGRCARFFAPSDPHTTRKRARPCSSCHRSGLALGLGRGTMTRRRGIWHFQPAVRPGDLPDWMPSWPDGVPWDGWTRLIPTPAARATRRGAHPLLPQTMVRVLAVSECIDCHTRYDDPIYQNFQDSLARMRSGAVPRCRAPQPTAP